MKKILILSSILFLVNLGRMSAQIGINYTPQAGDVKTSPLVIKKNTDAIPNRTNQLRFKTNETIVPYELILSDANGNIKWGSIPDITKPINGVFSPSGFSYSNSGNTSRHGLETNAYIDLPPGKWAVNLNFRLNVAKSRTEISSRTETITTIIPARQITVTYTSVSKVTQANSTASSTQYSTNNSEAVANGFRYAYYQTGDVLTSSSCDKSNPRKCNYKFTRIITIPQTTQTTSVVIKDYSYTPLLRSEAIWAKITLSENQTSANYTNYNADRTPDTNVDGRDLFLISCGIVGPATFSTFNGELYVHNKTNATKRYYVKLNLEPKYMSNYVVTNFALGPQDNHNDRFFAIPAE